MKRETWCVLRVPWAVVCSLLALLLALTACGGAAPVQPDASAVAEFAGITLPTSAREVRVYCEQGIDRFCKLRFTLDVVDLPGFLAQFTRPEDGYYPFANRVELSWWDAPNAEQYIGAQDWYGNVCRQLMVDLTTPGIPVVYLVAFEM